MLGLFKKKQKAVCFNNCKEVTFQVFIDCVVNKDYKGLIKSGNPTEAELIAAFDVIFNEYVELSGDNHLQTFLLLVKDIKLLTNRLNIIQLIVDQLTITYDERLTQYLRDLGFFFQFKNDETLKADLKRTIIQSKMQLLQLNQNKAELEELQRNSKNNAVSEMDYYMQLGELSKHQGYQINAKNISIYDYICILKLFKAQNKVK